MIAKWFGINILKEEEVVNLFAGGFVEADSIHFFAIRGGVGDPNFIAHDDRGGPGTAGDGCFPDDVFVLAPLGREAVRPAIGGCRVVAVVRGSAESGPVGMAGKS